MLERNSLPNTDELPLRFRGRQWYLRKTLPSGRRLEYGLGTRNRDEAARRAKEVFHDKLNATHLTEWQAKVAKGLQPKGWLRVMLTNCQARARAKNWRAIDLAALEMIANRCGGFCEVSGLPFEIGTDKRNPMQPSLDRIDSTRGYEADNVRLVLLCANYCMSHWGEEVFVRLSAGVVQMHLRKLTGRGNIR